MSHHDPTVDDERIRRALAWTRAGLIVERALRAFWPLAAFLGALFAALAFGAAETLGREALRWTLGAAGLAALGLTGWGARRFRWPGLRAAEARLDATLAGRPLAGLRDRPALGVGDAAVAALWARHLARLRARAASSRPVPGDLRLARFDPWALRLMALVLVVAAGLFGGHAVWAPVARAVAPGPMAEAAGPSFEGWAAPPRHTGLPTLYLTDATGDGPLDVPEGTRITLRVYGGDDATLRETVSGGETALDEADGVARAAFEVRQAGEVVLEAQRGDLASWLFAPLPDAPPEIAAASDVTQSIRGEMQLDVAASDDYGVTVAAAEITLDLAAVDRRHGLAVAPEPRAPLRVEVALPPAGDRREIEARLLEDVSKHLWVGLPVRIELLAEDAAGQIGRSEPIAAVLPGRRFYDPMAAALIEQRRDLLWSAENAARVVQVLRAITVAPDDVFDSARAYMLTRMAIRRLDAAVRAGRAEAERDSAAEALWRAAELLEDGRLGDAAERLAKARERLQQALRDDAPDAEIARLMEALRQATRDYMEQLAREAIERGETQQAQDGSQGQEITRDRIQEMLDRIEELSEQGRKAEAEALLEQLQALLESLQVQLAEGGQGGEGSGMPGDAGMEGLADALRQQQGLADESFQQMQREFRENRDALTPGRGTGGAREDLAGRQEALRGMMDEMRKGLAGEEGAREALDEAGRDMAAARDGLREGDLYSTLDAQSQAIDNLREAMRALAQSEPREGREGAGNAENGRRGTDPLGREYGGMGEAGTRERMLQDLGAGARARAILDEIRRRSGDRSRPEIERDYLRRLLDRF